jgi:small neutral amino acid transporter SnatA (MarC family)
MELTQQVSLQCTQLTAKTHGIFSKMIFPIIFLAFLQLPFYLLLQSSTQLQTTSKLLVFLIGLNMVKMEIPCQNLFSPSVSDSTQQVNLNFPTAIPVLISLNNYQQFHPALLSTRSMAWVHQLNSVVKNTILATWLQHQIFQAQTGVIIGYSIVISWWTMT